MAALAAHRHAGAPRRIGAAWAIIHAPGEMAEHVYSLCCATLSLVVCPRNVSWLFHVNAPQWLEKRRHGFHLLSEHCDEYLIPIGFGVDYEAMDANWPVKGLAQEVRQALLTKIHEVAHGKCEPVISTGFLFQRTD